MKTIKVVCGIIWKDDKVFIARRKPEKSMGGYWEFPGGKIEIDEKPEDALARELREEIGMEIIVRKFLDKNLYRYNDKYIELHAYDCKFNFASFVLTDHDKYCFAYPSELTSYFFCPADNFFVSKITNSIWKNINV